MKNKPKEEIERINKAKMHDFKGFSLISQEVFWSLTEHLESLNNVYFATLDVNKEKDMSGSCHEYMILTDDKKAFFIDFIIKNKNKIIEFDGDYWHGSSSNKKRDKERDNKLKELGYNTLRIKEIDWKENPNEVIQKCKEFINE